MAEADLHLDHVLEHVFSYVYVQLKLPTNESDGNVIHFGVQPHGLK